MYTPVETSNNNTYGSNHWIAFSPKLGRWVKGYSSLEYDHWLLIETNYLVATFCEQALRIKGVLDGEHVESVFDMWIMWTSGIEEFVEVKYRSHLDPKAPEFDPRSFNQVRFQAKWCKSNNRNYALRTDDIIRKNPLYLRNMERIISYLRHHLKPVETDCYNVIRFLGDTPISIQQLATVLRPSLSRSNIIEAISWLYVLGKIQGNFDVCVLGPQTQVRLCNSHSAGGREWDASVH